VSGVQYFIAFVLNNIHLWSKLHLGGWQLKTGGWTGKRIEIHRMSSMIKTSDLQNVNKINLQVRSPQPLIQVLCICRENHQNGEIRQNSVVWSWWYQVGRAQCQHRIQPTNRTVEKQNNSDQNYAINMNHQNSALWFLCYVYVSCSDWWHDISYRIEYHDIKVVLWHIFIGIIAPQTKSIFRTTLRNDCAITKYLSHATAGRAATKRPCRAATKQ